MGEGRSGVVPAAFPLVSMASRYTPNRSRQPFSPRGFCFADDATNGSLGERANQVTPLPRSLPHSPQVHCGTPAHVRSRAHDAITKMPTGG